jgi:hypothetical protein
LWTAIRRWCCFGPVAEEQDEFEFPIYSSNEAFEIAETQDDLGLIDDYWQATDYAKSAPDNLFNISTSIAGCQRYQMVMVGMGKKESSGDADNQRKQDYQLEHGIKVSWDDIETIRPQSSHDESGVAPGKHPLVLVVSPLKPSTQFVSIQALVLMQASGRLAASGDSVSPTLVIYEGHALRPVILRLNSNGCDLTEYLKMILNERGFSLTSSAEHEIVRDIKVLVASLNTIDDEQLRRTKAFEVLETVDSSAEAAGPQFKVNQ